MRKTVRHLFNGPKRVAAVMTSLFSGIFISDDGSIGFARQRGWKISLIILVSGLVSGLAVAVLAGVIPVDARLVAMSLMGALLFVLMLLAREIRRGRALRSSRRSATVPDFPFRERLVSDLPDISDTYKGRTILVSGAGGSIGSELCRHLLGSEPACLVLLEHSEPALFSIDLELRLSVAALGVRIIPVIGSVCDAALVRQTLLDHRVEIVLHVAAHKHVPLVETNEVEGLRNNVMGTRVLGEAAKDTGCKSFVLVSSDKAVRPTNVMGASKRLAELVVQDLAAQNGDTLFSMVRFGNVLGSSGSVVPLFHDQIAKGGPVTLTSPDMSRYFMTLPEAARLVLLAGSFARGGDVFMLDMGQPVPIRKLARCMIEHAGHTVRDAANPGGDIDIIVTGLRPGEKLSEELLIGSDMQTTPHPRILRACEAKLSEFEVATMLRDLQVVINTGDRQMARALIARWVDGYHQPSEQVGSRLAR